MTPGWLLRAWDAAREEDLERTLERVPRPRLDGWRQPARGDGRKVRGKRGGLWRGTYPELRSVPDLPRFSSFARTLAVAATVILVALALHVSGWVPAAIGLPLFGLTDEAFYNAWWASAEPALLPGSGSMYNAGWFGDVGDARETRIALAVATIPAGSLLWIPRPMQPYTPSLVPFDPLKKMVREGGTLDANTWDVKAYGCTGDDVADETLGLRGAYAGADAAGGGTVEYPLGRYRVTDSVFVPAYVKTKGAGPDGVDAGTGNSLGKGSSLHSTNGIMAGLPILDISTRCVVENMGFEVDGNNARFNTVLAIADLTAPAEHAMIHNCHFQRIGAAAIKLRGGVATITCNRGDNCNSHLIWLRNDGVGFGSDAYVAFNDSGGNQSFLDVAGAVGAALYLDHCGECTVIGNQFYEFQYGVWVQGGLGHRIADNRCEKNGVTGFQIDTAAVRVNLTGNRAFNNGLTAGATGAGIKLDNVSRCNVTGGVLGTETVADYGAAAQKFGVWINNAARFNSVKGVTIDAVIMDGVRVIGASHNNVIENCYLYFVQNHGVLVDGSDDCELLDLTIYAASQQTDNTYNGITVGSNNCARTVVSRNEIRSGGGAKQPQWGVQFVAGATDSVCELNDLRGAGRSGPIADAGANTARSGNKLVPGGVMSGIAALVAGTVVIATTEIQAGDNGAGGRVWLTKSVGGGAARGILELGAIVAGVNFTVNAMTAGAVLAADTSTIGWKIDH